MSLLRTLVYSIGVAPEAPLVCFVFLMVEVGGSCWGELVKRWESSTMACCATRSEGGS